MRITGAIQCVLATVLGFLSQHPGRRYSDYMRDSFSPAEPLPGRECQYVYRILPNMHRRRLPSASSRHALGSENRNLRPGRQSASRARRNCASDRQRAKCCAIDETATAHSTNTVTVCSLRYYYAHGVCCTHGWLRIVHFCFALERRRGS